MQTPLRMMKMHITGEEGWALLNGIRRRKRKGTVPSRLVVTLALVLLGLGIVLPLFPEIRRYLRMQRM